MLMLQYPTPQECENINHAAKLLIWHLYVTKTLQLHSYGKASQFGFLLNYMKLFFIFSSELGQLLPHYFNLS